MHICVNVYKWLYGKYEKLETLSLKMDMEILS